MHKYLHQKIITNPVEDFSEPMFFYIQGRFSPCVHLRQKTSIKTTVMAEDRV